MSSATLRRRRKASYKGGPISKERFLAEIYHSLASYAQKGRRRSFEIAVLTPLTGKWAKGGWITKRGYDIWAEQANGSGGIEVAGARYPVRLIYYDTRSDPNYARNLAEELLAHEQIDFIFGPYSSDETLAIARVIERFKIPHITGSAESDEILKQGFEWTFGVLLTDSSPVKAPLKLLKQELDPSVASAAILSADDSFSRSTAKAFSTAVEELRLKLKYRATYPSHQEEFAPLVWEVKRANPDVLIVSGHIDNLINIIRATKFLNYSPKACVMHYGVATQDFIDALGSDAKHILGVSQWSPEIDCRDPVFGTAQDFHRLFISRYNRQPDHTEAGCAATGVIFQQLIERSELKPPLGMKDKLLLRDMLWELEFETFFGPIRFVRRTANRKE